jgi:hypothetical protein
LVRIPIAVTEAEFRLDAFVVSDQAQSLVLALEGPDGQVQTFEALASAPGAQIARSQRLGMARVPTPFGIPGVGTWGPGTWHLLISHPWRQDSGEYVASHASSAVGAASKRSISYAAVVNVRSSLQFSVNAQVLAGLGAHFLIEATGTFLGVPLHTKPRVLASVLTPSGLNLSVPLEAAEPGRFVARFEAVQPGTYPMRIRAQGHSPAGHLFARELTLTPSLLPSAAPEDCCPAHAYDPRERPSLRAILRHCLCETPRRLLDCVRGGKRRC